MYSSPTNDLPQAVGIKDVFIGVTNPSFGNGGMKEVNIVKKSRNAS